MSNINKIKAYIERLYDGEAPKHDQQCEFEDGYFTGIATISKFIDSLPDNDSLDESKIASKDLEEAAEYLFETIEIQEHENIFEDTFKKIFIAGAEWQYQKDRGQFAKLKAKEWSDGYNEGIAKGKEQMMKDAIHYVVQDDLDSHGVSYNIPFIRIGRVALEPKGIGVGDKVKIIIVKNGKDK